MTNEEKLNEAIEFLKKYGNEEDVDKAIENLKAAKEQVKESQEKIHQQISRSKIMKDIVRNTRTYRLLVIFLGLLFVLALALWVCEPGITSYGDSLWLCFAAATTIGFGDIVATTFIGRICVVVLSLYAIILTAIITSIIVTYHNQVMQAQTHGSIVEFMDKLERLPELSHEELVELSETIKSYKW